MNLFVDRGVGEVVAASTCSDALKASLNNGGIIAFSMRMIVRKSRAYALRQLPLP